MTGDKLFSRIVAPTDGSHLSNSAALAAAVLARQAGVPITLFGITETEHERAGLLRHLDELVVTLRRDLVVDVVVDAVGSDVNVGTYVANAILEEADTDESLVCIASHGRSGLAAALLGSTTEEVLRQSPRPVLVVGPNNELRTWRDDGMVVASVDGSRFSEKAIPAAAAWSAAFGLPLWLIQVADPGGGPGPRVVGRGDFNETAYLRNLAADYPHVDFDVLHNHHPARELADLTKRSPVALLVMATHGRSGWSRVTLGSVAMNVVHHATCPVLLVRPDDAP